MIEREKRVAEVLKVLSALDQNMELFGRLDVLLIALMTLVAREGGLESLQHLPPVLNVRCLQLVDNFKKADPLVKDMRADMARAMAVATGKEVPPVGKAPS
jgi:hypothetical protein